MTVSSVFGRRDEKGAPVASICPACKKEEEDWEHYEYGCEVGAQLREKVAKRAGRLSPELSRAERTLETSMEMTLKVMIAKARWIFHCERCKIDNGKRKRMNLTVVMQRLDRRMKIVEKMRR